MADEFLCETAEVRHFIRTVQAIVAGTATVDAWLTAIRPHFSHLLADPTWLPDAFRHIGDGGGMGHGSANWLLYRDTAGTLSLSALVLAPGTATPVHDHLAWGLVGLYAGAQEEEVYAAAGPVGPDAQHTALTLVATNQLHQGAFYTLLPPTGDIHRVVTTGAEPSISLHLLGNDVGCVLRHRFDPDSGAVAPFRSGYTNHACEADNAGPV